MATKKKLAEQVLLKLSGGMVKPDSQTDIREIMADLDWLRDEYVKKNYFLNKNFGSNVIDQEYLGEYSADLTRSDQLVMLHGDSFELPHKPIALPRNEGIQAVYEDISGKHYLIIDGAQAGIYRGKRALDVPDRSYVYFTGGTGHIISNVSEWFLPSIDELSAIQENLYEAGIGNLYWGDYWSSSESTANFAYEITMFSGSI